MKKRASHIQFLTDSLEFPPTEMANDEGLLAVGGDLTPERLLLAYKTGIFPWYSEGSPILWWSPDPRMVLFPENIRISKSMRRLMNRNPFTITRNAKFKEVVHQCAIAKRKGQQGTWILGEIETAYLQLHQLGIAISYEVWEANKLVGGLYGVDLGHVFCGESMFSKVSNASKYALIHVARQCHSRDYKLIDCQTYSDHLERMGAEEISRSEFIKILQKKK